MSLLLPKGPGRPSLAFAEPVGKVRGGTEAEIIADFLDREGGFGEGVTTLKERLATASDSWTETSFRNAA